MFPKLIDLGPLTLHWYGLLLASAFLLGIKLLARLLKEEGVPESRAWDLGFVIIVSAVLGAKLLMVLGDAQRYLQDPSLFLSKEFWQAGGAFYGGLMGAVAGGAFYLSRQPDLRFWTVADAAAPAIALGQAVGRVGCFAAGCDYGKPTTLPWAVTFTSEYAHRFVGVPLHVGLHPVQLYESACTLLLGLGLLWLYRRRSFQGQVFSYYLLGYGVIRFLVEFFRGDPGRGFVLEGMLSVPQVISLGMVAAALLAYRRRRASQRPA